MPLCHNHEGEKGGGRKGRGGQGEVEGSGIYHTKDLVDFHEGSLNECEVAKNAAQCTQCNKSMS